VHFREIGSCNSQRSSDTIPNHGAAGMQVKNPIIKLQQDSLIFLHSSAVSNQQQASSQINIGRVQNKFGFTLIGFYVNKRLSIFIFVFQQ